MADSVLENVMPGPLGTSGRPWWFFAPVMGNRALRDRAEAALERVGLTDNGHSRTAAS